MAVASLGIFLAWSISSLLERACIPLQFLLAGHRRSPLALGKGELQTVRLSPESEGSNAALGAAAFAIVFACLRVTPLGNRALEGFKSMGQIPVVLAVGYLCLHVLRISLPRVGRRVWLYGMLMPASIAALVFVNGFMIPGRDTEGIIDVEEAEAMDWGPVQRAFERLPVIGPFASQAWSVGRVSWLAFVTSLIATVGVPGVDHLAAAGGRERLGSALFIGISVMWTTSCASIIRKILIAVGLSPVARELPTIRGLLSLFAVGWRISYIPAKSAARVAAKKLPSAGDALRASLVWTVEAAVPLLVLTALFTNALTIGALESPASRVAAPRPFFTACAVPPAFPNVSHMHAPQQRLLCDVGNLPASRSSAVAALHYPTFKIRDWDSWGFREDVILFQALLNIDSALGRALRRPAAVDRSFHHLRDCRRLHSRWAAESAAKVGALMVPGVSRWAAEVTAGACAMVHGLQILAVDGLYAFMRPAIALQSNSLLPSG